MNCKSITYAFLFFLTSVKICAQISLTNSYFPAAGDTFRVATATAATARLVTITPAGGNQTWNFDFLRSERNNTVFNVERYKNIASDTAAKSQYPDGELIRQTDSGQVAVLNRTTTKLELLGFKGFDMGMIQIPNVAFRYAPPLNERHAPLVYNLPTISFTSNFTATVPSNVLPDTLLRQLPIRPDSLRINYKVSREDKTDAWGTVLLPSATQPVSALRERRREIREFRLEAKLSIFPWVDVTSFVLAAINSDLKQPRDTVISYYFWSNTTKQPLVIINANAQDSVNFVRFKWSPLLSPTADTEGVDAVSLAVFPNPAKAANGAFVEIKNWKSTHYNITIIQADGRVVSNLKSEVPSKEHFNIPLPALPQGIYWLQISDNGKVKTVKFVMNH